MGIDLQKHLKNKYFILERRGKFLACERFYEKPWPWSKPKENYRVMYKGLSTPAHFDTLEDAGTWLKLQLKEDVIHELK